MLSDGRLVAFKCGHHHRSKSAALECVETRGRQLLRGQNTHLITRVLETPESRERARQRAEQRQAKREARAETKQRLARERQDLRKASTSADSERGHSRIESAVRRWRPSRLAMIT